MLAAPSPSQPVPSPSAPTRPIARARRLADIVVATVLALAVLPVVIATAVAVLIVDGRPIFYRGHRLGIGMRAFRIYKFRTLVNDAESKLGAELETRGAHLRTRLGGFLRDTRFDELPQLWNVIRGDMTFLGPRPERAVVYDKHRGQVANYELRFQVPPGLVGYSQLLTPHGAPKRFRARLDNRFVLAPPGLLRSVWLIVLTGRAVVGSAAAKIWRRALRTGLRRSDRRAFQRHPGPAGSVLMSTEHTQLAQLVDANSETALVRMTGPIRTEPLLVLVAYGRGAHVTRFRRAKCHVLEVYRRPGLADDEMLVDFEPATPMAEYVISQYLLHESMIRRRGSRRSRAT